LSQDQLDADARTLAAATPRALALLELLALRPNAVPLDVVGFLYGCAGYEAGGVSLSPEVVRVALMPMSRLLGEPIHQGTQRLRRPAIRRRLLESLQDSSRAGIWRQNVERIGGNLRKAGYFHRVPASALALRALLLSGVGIGKILRALADDQPGVTLDWQAAAQDVLPVPMDLKRLQRLDPTIAQRQIAHLLEARAQLPDTDMPRLFDIAVELMPQAEVEQLPLRAIAVCAWIAGRSDVLALLPESAALAHRDVLLLDLAVASDRPEAVVEYLRAASKRPSKKAPPGPDASQELWTDLPGAFARLALLAAGNSEDRALLQRMLRKLWKEHLGHQSDRWIENCLDCQMVGHPWPAPRMAKAPGSTASPRLDSVSVLVLVLLHHWNGLEPDAGVAEAVSATVQHLRTLKLSRMADLIASIQAGTAGAGPALWSRQQQPWQRLLSALDELSRAPEKSPAKPTGADKPSRIRALVGALDPAGHGVHIRFFEQRQSAGGWTPGRQLTTPNQMQTALTRMAIDNDGDRLLLKLLAQPDCSYYGERLWAESPVLDVLSGCSELVAESDQRPLRIELVKPVLTVERRPDQRLLLAFSPAPDLRTPARMALVGDCLQVIRFSNEHLRIARLIEGGGDLPEESLPELVKLLPGLTRTLGVDARLPDAEALSEIDHRIHALIEPLRDGLRVRLRVRPLGEFGVHLLPGSGHPELIGVRDGLPVRGTRDLPAEQQSLSQLLQGVPDLSGAESIEGLDFAEAPGALEVLSALSERSEEVPMSWPAERRWNMTRTLGASSLRLKVKAQKDWFHAEGGLSLDDGSVVTLATLLEALPSSQGRFVRLSGDRIVALSQDLARRLNGLRALADERGRIELAPVAAAALQPLLDSDAELDLDQRFREQLQRIEQAAARTHELPRNLQVELRDYQLDGYRWLMRLADWGGGACLADDMGLGKTIQALAVLAARAAMGPALVVAPTSVVSNWRNELRRFAPALEVITYGDGDRAAALESLAAGSVMLVSYGLLTTNIEAFAPIRFATLVLDEAQAVKNAQAQRTLAVRRIDAQARIATTGTPIENHLGELWSLMRILNPGLLGSQEGFSKRFIAPLERDPRAPERDTLRRLIAPFLLRRLKSQVLDELPPRTEIVLTIEPGAEEAALLAAVRRQSIERLAQGGVAEESKRFHVLAELTRMRRAACHPRLVAPEFKLAGAKLEQLLELVQELKENHHRALVFSQFTDYLAIVREAFDAQAISYQYLDGSTSIKARESAVRDFQNGSGDVFLLSLKAGGVGLNLTAADYVIHLDPWWNPAVEQQATDRAHRIGQTRPVTVYKLVVKGSIEEQILSLHGSKRELVDSVLGEQEVSKPISVDELVGLLQG
jgi:SNF2 family DNA or RNA helicase